MIEEDLLQKFRADNFGLLGTDSLSVSYNHTPETAPDTRIYFQRQTTDHERLIGGRSVIEHIVFDVECVSRDMSTALRLAAKVRDLAEFRGPLGGSWVQACDVQDQGDTYIYHHDYADEGLTVDALRLEVMI